MNEWPKTRIKGSSYLKGRIGWQGLRASEFLEEGPYLITGTDFKSGKIDWSTCYHVSEARFAEASYIHIRDNDLLITKDGTIGKIALVTNCPEKAVLNSGVFLLRSSRGDYDHGFAYFVLTSDIFKTFLRTHLNGSTINHLYQYVFENFEIPAPPLPTQQKIARILQTVDRAMEKTEALIAKYQQIKAGLMQDLFTRGLWTQEELDRGDHVEAAKKAGLPAIASATAGQLRPTRQDAPHLYQETPIGWIPKAWDSKPLGNACNWFSGGTPSRGRVDWWMGNVPWLSPKDMKSFQLSDTGEHVTEHAAMVGSRMMPKASVFIVIRGMILAHSFPVVVSTKPFCFNQDVKAMSGRGSLDNRLLAYWLQSKKDLFLRKTTESTHGTKRFDMKDIYEITIGIPKPIEQSGIIDRLDSIRSKIEMEQIALAKLKTQKSGLMHDLLTGKVPVTQDPDEASGES